MATISLATYSVRVRLKRQKEDYEEFGKVGGNTNFCAACRKVLTSLKRKHQRQDEAQHVLRVNSLNSEGDGMWGTIVSGEFGYEAEGVNAETFKNSYTRTKDDAELLPFYFYLELPRDKSIGILITQRYGHFGTYSSLRRALKEHFAEALPDYEVEFSRLVPASVLETYLKGELTTISIRSYYVPEEVTDRFHLGANLRKEASYTVTFRAKRGKYLKEPGFVTRWRTGKASIIELPDEFDMARTRVKLGYEVDGKTRLMDTLDLASMAPYFDVTEEVKIGENGHPTLESLHALALEHAKELRKQIGASDE